MRLKEKNELDTILIDRLEIEVIIGTEEFEREHPQRVIISAEIRLYSQSAGYSDNLADTLNYDEIIKGIEQLTRQGSFQLLEALAERIAEFILKYDRVADVTLTVLKPDIYSHVNAVGLKIYRYK